MSINFTLVLFVPRAESDTASLFDLIDAQVRPLAAEKLLSRWHLYQVDEPHRCLEHFPRAFLTREGGWHEYDASLEKAAQRLVKRRQKAFAAIQEEEALAHETETAEWRTLVRFAMWEADHPFPLTPWRQCWRNALLEHATLMVVYLACERQVPLHAGEGGAGSTEVG